jgi:hypothetical protein
VVAPFRSRQRHVGIEEAVREEAHIERTAEMGEHCTQALGIDNMAGKIILAVEPQREADGLDSHNRRDYLRVEGGNIGRVSCGRLTSALR